MADRYDNFAELAAAETEGVDYAIRLTTRLSPVTVIAPHGGYIEPTSSLIATAIAAQTYSLYCFESLDLDRPHSDLHITSTHFDEPQALALVGKSEVVVAIHGCTDHGAPLTVLVGGRDRRLRRSIGAALAAAGFRRRTTGHRFPGTDPQNICNRGARHAGTQLEIPRTLRDQLAADPVLLDKFCIAVAGAIQSRLLELQP